jgi:methionine-rich copper-binding protein CopC
MKRFAVVLALVIAALVAGAGVASAHNVLIGSDPPDGASIATGPAQVRLTFDLPLRAGFTAMTVVGPGGSRWEGSPPAVTDNTVSVQVHPLGPAGVYQVGYRVVSDDGHPVSGSVHFTLTSAGTGTPNPAPAAAPTGGGSGGTSGGMPLWPFLVGAVVLLVGGTVATLRLGRDPDERVRRGRRTPHGRPSR